MVIRGNKSRAVVLVAMVVGFALPAAAVYVALRHAWPPAHDLSDIGTGLMRDGLALFAGICGAILAKLYLRWRR